MTTRRNQKKQVTVHQRQTARVTNANVYDAIFQLDKGVSQRFTTVMDSINGLGDRMTAHEERHTQSERASAIATEIKFDAKKAGIMGFLVALIAAISEVVRRMFV